MKHLSQHSAGKMLFLFWGSMDPPPQAPTGKKYQGHLSVKGQDFGKKMYISDYSQFFGKLHMACFQNHREKFHAKCSKIVKSGAVTHVLKEHGTGVILTAGVETEGKGITLG